MTAALLDLLRPGGLALVRFWRPMLLIQTAAFVLVVAYYASGDVRSALARVGEAKARGGLVAVAVVGALAGAVLPEVARFVVERGRYRLDLGLVGFKLLLFAFMGTLTDRFYALLTVLYGDEPSVGVVLAKLATDMLGYTFFVGVPLFLLAFEWRGDGYRLGRTLRRLGWGGFARRHLTVYVPNVGFWGPMVLLVYALPLALQFPLAMCAQGAWSLLVTFLASGEDRTIDAENRASDVLERPGVPNVE